MSNVLFGEILLISICWLTLTFLPGCGRPTGEVAWFRSTVTGRIYGSGELMDRIERLDSPSRLEEMRKIYLERGGRSGEIMGAFDRRRKELDR